MALGDRRKKVVVFGNVGLSSLHCYYITHDSPYDVVAYTVDEAYIAERTFCGLPVVPFENIETEFPPDDYQLSILLGYRDVNRLRAEKYAEAKKKGYEFLSYISSKSTVWPGVEIGENSHVYEGAIIQPFTTIGNNVVIGPATFVGHHTVVKDHCFIATQASLLGGVTVEPYCVLGTNATVVDRISIARECIIGANSLISSNTAERGVYISKAAERISRRSDQLGRILTWSSEL